MMQSSSFSFCVAATALLASASHAFTMSTSKNTLLHDRILSLSTTTSLQYQTSSPKIDREEQTASSLPFLQPIAFTSSSPSVGALPWLGRDHNIDNNVFLSHWDWQLEYFEQHLTRLRVNPDFVGEELMYVETKDAEQPTQRIYTVSLQSDEYRDIRMTYLHCGDKAQIFRCTCYPRNDMPILGMGMMQFAGGVRNVAIIDFQPLLEDDEGQAMYTSTLEQIRSAANPALQQPMSNRHFDPTEQKYFTAHPIIGKWGSADTDVVAAAKLAHDLRATHQDCVRAHVGLTKATVECPTPLSNLPEAYTEQLHSSYDTFVAAKEPASQLLSAAFGKDIAERLVHEIIFPLSVQR
jgi:15,16-dihydrobiliverdin:ferredoxin oxidoreductase